jgi:N-acetyl-anhydromuramyl-L-alanine amidase AmpD
MIDQNLIDNPPFIEAAGYHKGRIKTVELIVIHTMEAPDKGDTALRTAKYFQNAGLKASAHYCVDNTEIIQCVHDSDTAWHCVNANANGIGIEHAGFAKQTANDWMSDYNKAMLEISAQESAVLCKKYGIPVRKAVFAGANDPTVKEKGFCGHAEVPLHGDHWDPGTDFPWDYYFDLINKILAGDDSGNNTDSTDTTDTPPDPIQPSAGGESSSGAKTAIVGN